MLETKDDTIKRLERELVFANFKITVREGKVELLERENGLVGVAGKKRSCHYRNMTELLSWALMKSMLDVCSILHMAPFYGHYQGCWKEETTFKSLAPSGRFVSPYTAENGGGL